MSPLSLGASVATARSHSLKPQRFVTSPPAFAAPLVPLPCILSASTGKTSLQRSAAGARHCQESSKQRPVAGCFRCSPGTWSDFSLSWVKQDLNYDFSFPSVTPFHKTPFARPPLFVFHLLMGAACSSHGDVSHAFICPCIRSDCPLSWGGKP